MENSNRNHRVLAGVLTAAMVLSSFSVGTAGAFAADVKNETPNGYSQLRGEEAGFVAPTDAYVAAGTQTYGDAESAITAAVQANAVAASKTANGTFAFTTGTGDAITTTDSIATKTVVLKYTYTAKDGDTNDIGTQAAAEITVHVRAVKPEETAAAINYSDETIALTGVEANTAENFGGTTVGAGSITSLIKNTDQTIYIRTAATENVEASESVPVTIKARPAAPTDVKVDYAKETIVAAATEEYQVGGAAAVAGTGAEVSITASIPATDTTDVKYWTKATDSAFKSAEGKISLSARPATPAAPAATDANITSTSVNLTPVTGAEYSKDGKAWQDGTKFTDLTANTKYTFHQRIKATASAFKSAEATADITTKDASVQSSAKSITSVKVDTKDYTPVLAKDGKTYTVTLPEGTTLPTAADGFVLSVSDKASTGTVTKGEDGSFSVTVTAEDATTTAYTIKFVNAAKAEATATTTTLAVTKGDTAVTGSTYGDALTLTAAVKKGDAAAVVADGKVEFYEGETKLGDAVAIADGKATATVSTLAAGAHSITAKFVPADATKVKESASTAASVTVAKKALTAVVTADNEKTYDGKATATVKLTLTGVVDKDDVTATAAATLEDANAGDKKAIKSITGAALAGTTAGNYTLADTAVATKTGAEDAKTDITVKVNKAAAPVMAAQTEYVKVGTDVVNGTSDLSKLFPVAADAGTTSYAVTATPDTVFTAAAIDNTDNKTLKYTVAAGAEKDKNLAVTVAVTTLNYTYAPVTLTLTTTDKTIVDVSAFNITGKTYDGKEIDKPVVKDAKGTEISGTIAYTKDGTAFTGTPKDAGKYTAVFTVSGDEEVGTKTVNFEIAKAIVTVTAPSDGITVGDTYDVSKKAPTITGLIGEDELTTAPVLAVYDAKGVAIEAAKIKDLVAGTYTIGFSTEPATTNANYEVKNVNGKLTVSAKPSGPSYPSGPSTPSEPAVAPVQVTATAASSNATVKAALDKIVAGKDDKSVVATFKKTDKKIAISATTLAGQNVYIYKLIGNTLAVVDNKAEAVGKDGTLTMDNPEAAVTKKLARTADDSTVTYVLIPATEKPPVASVSGTVEVAQGNVVLFDVTSGKSTDAGFAAGNDAVSETRLYTAYKDGKASYGAYGHGKEGQTTGIYVNGVKLFDVKVVKAPYKSDTTVNITNKKHGAMYWFEITPDNASATVSYTAGNGAVLSTRSKGKQKDGSYLFGFQITGKTGDKSGVYVQINGQNYCVFNVTVA